MIFLLTGLPTGWHDLPTSWHDSPAPAPGFDRIGAAFLAAVFYGCSAYSFTQIVSGHFLYLIALAVFPWAALLISRARSSAVAVIFGGVLLAVSFVQLQFIILAPLALLFISWILGSKRIAFRSALALLVAVVPHLPWLIPLGVYPPHVSLQAYLLPGTDAAFSVNPLDGLRLVGYVTPFAELSVASWSGIWRPLSFLLLALCGMGLMLLSKKRAAATVVLVSAVLYYQWGAFAPGYNLWSGFIPWPLHGLFRERFALSFLTLIVLTMLLYLGIQYLFAVWRWPAALIIAGALTGAVGPFLDGHLGPYGIVREEFTTGATLSDFIAAHGGGTVMTVPSGSIVKGVGWAYYGRSPFSLGGPPLLLDAENAPGARALPMVQSVARILNRPSIGDTSLLEEYLRLLRVHFVVDWLRWTGDTPFDRALVEANLERVGAYQAWRNGDAILWEFPGVSSKPAVMQADRLYVSSGIHPGGLDGADTWSAPFVVSGSGTGADVNAAAQLSSGLVHLTNRKVSVSRSAHDLLIVEPVFKSVSGQLREIGQRYKLVLPSTVAGPLGFGDGTLIPMGDSTLSVQGPVDRVYIASSRIVVSAEPTSIVTTMPEQAVTEFGHHAITVNPDLSQVVGNVQDTNHVAGVSLEEAGIYARLVDESGSRYVLVSARRDQAGLPIPLPLQRTSDYEISLQSQYVSGPRARLLVRADGKTTLAEVGLPFDKAWRTTRISFTPPPDVGAMTLYLFVDGMNNGVASGEAISDVSVTVRPQFPDVVIDLSPDGTTCAAASVCGARPLIWAVLLRGSDPWWSLNGSVRKMPFSANGFGDAWLVRTSGNTVRYLPDALYKSLLPWVVLPYAAVSIVYALFILLINDRFDLAVVVARIRMPVDRRLRGHEGSTETVDASARIDEGRT